MKIMTQVQPDVYRQLQQHLNHLPVGLPSTKSGVELRILHHLFSIEEAQLGMCLGIIPSSLSTIWRRVKRKKLAIFTKTMLETKLDQMCDKGLIYWMNIMGKKKYGNMFLAIGMYEFQVNHLDKSFMENMHEYRPDFGQEFNSSKVPQLRTVPIQSAITPENKIATYDDIYQFLKNYTGIISVANCICRQGEDLLNHECKQTKLRETCITFGEGAKDYIKRGQGRPISSIEAITILDQASKDSLVLQPGNALEPFCICCCCGDCCGVLTVAKKYPRPVELFSTNYYAQIDSKLCSGCGICLKRCQMDAINKESDKTGKAKVNLDRCIGCGLCVPMCPTHAVHLVQKAKAKIPPPNLPLLYVKILMNKPGIKEKIRFIARALVGMPV